MTTAALPRPRELLEDLTAEHQIIIRFTGGFHDVMVSCTCLRVARACRARYEMIERRFLFPAAELITAWRDWHQAEGIS